MAMMAMIADVVEYDDERLSSGAVFEEDAAVDGAIFRTDTPFALSARLARIARCTRLTIAAGGSVGTRWAFRSLWTRSTILTGIARCARRAWWS
jgi:hypothetical protein